MNVAHFTCDNCGQEVFADVLIALFEAGQAGRNVYLLCETCIIILAESDTLDDQITLKGDKAWHWGGEPIV